jgi:DNA-binding IclR family transcriptional regulator
MEQPAKNPVETTKKSFRLVEALKECDGAGVTELADRLEMSKSVVHNHLSTLREEGYVIKRNGEYALGLKFLELGGYTRKQIELYRAARPEINELAEQSGELVNLLTESQGMGVYLYRAKGDQAVDLNTHTGFRTHLHSTALGKCLLASMSEDRVAEVVDERGLPSATENTITDRSELYDRLEEVRQQRYAIGNAERLEGSRCVAAPIEGTDDVLGAISISAPAGRLSMDEAREGFRRMVQDVANVVELKVRY